ncbi:hypothetical protein Taro_053061, partial [Colocasia esculenta]|nr:hypothetical protein [Colocasia esculenta]
FPGYYTEAVANLLEGDWATANTRGGRCRTYDAARTMLQHLCEGDRATANTRGRRRAHDGEPRTPARLRPHCDTCSMATPRARHRNTPVRGRRCELREGRDARNTCASGYIGGTNIFCKGSVDTTILGVDTMVQNKGRNVKKSPSLVDTSLEQVDTRDRSTLDVIRSTLDAFPRRPDLMSGTTGRHENISGRH